MQKQLENTVQRVLLNHKTINTLSSKEFKDFYAYMQNDKRFYANPVHIIEKRREIMKVARIRKQQLDEIQRKQYQLRSMRMQKHIDYLQKPLYVQIKQKVLQCFSKQILQQKSGDKQCDSVKKTGSIQIKEQQYSQQQELLIKRQQSKNNQNKLKQQ